MLLVTSNKLKRLLYISYIGRIQTQDFQDSREELKSELEGLPPGFRMLTDFSQLEFMGLDCMPELGQVMDLIGKAGVGLVVRVIPDPGKDIGMNILTIFHYPHRPQIVTCQNMTEAVRALGL